MTALDTNVLVRYLAQDDDSQFQKVLQILNRKRVDFFVCDLVLAETDWVLRSLYDWSGAEVADAFARLTTIHNLTFENEARLRSSLKALREGADLADNSSSAPVETKEQTLSPLSTKTSSAGTSPSPLHRPEHPTTKPPRYRPAGSGENDL